MFLIYAFGGLTPFSKELYCAFGIRKKPGWPPRRAFPEKKVTAFLARISLTAKGNRDIF
jgi:hypothetical protein